MERPMDPARMPGEELKEEQIEELEEELVIADMSGLAPKRPILFPVFDPGAQMEAQKERVRSGAPKQPAGIDREGRLAAMKGALGASLLIWLVYAVAFGAFLFVLTRLFKLI